MKTNSTLCMPITSHINTVTSKGTGTKATFMSYNIVNGTSAVPSSPSTVTVMPTMSLTRLLPLGGFTSMLYAWQ